MAHKKAAGSAKNLRDSKPKYRGVKIFGGQPAVAGNIILRQKGDKYAAGKNTYKSNDFSIHALIDGIVTFKKKNISRFDGRKYLKTVVEISTAEEVLSKKSETPKKVAEKKEVVEKKTAPKVAKETVKKNPAKKSTEKKEPTTKKEKTGGEASIKKTPVKKAPAKK